MTLQNTSHHDVDCANEEQGVTAEQDSMTGSPLTEGLIEAGFRYESGALSHEGAPCELAEAIVGEGVTLIDNECFAKSPNLKRVVLPKTLCHLGVASFENCCSLETVNLPEGITRLRKSLFSGCKSLVRVTVPSTVCSIGEWAFRGCESLESVTLPSSVSDICAESFLACPKLVLRVQPDSYAERYAQKFGIRYVLAE